MIAPMIAGGVRGLRLLAVLALLGMGQARPALAWDAAGHRAIAAIAMDNITAQTSARIHTLLQARGRLNTPDCPIANLYDAANWPDCLRGDPAHWQFTYAWHYQDIPVCGGFSISAECAGGNCVSAQINRMRRILADRHQGDLQRLIALAFLTHFIGDIHQPLHVGDHGDRGGNQVIVEHQPLPVVGDPTRPESLHWFWDTLPDTALGDPARSLVRIYSPAQRARIATGDVADWARESYDLARSLAYARAFHHDPCTGPTPRVVNISAADVQAMLPVVRQRLVQAGLRLARVLDQALGS